MKFFSTRKNSPEVSFEGAIFKGLAPDGGLYHPVDEPDLSKLFLKMTRQEDFASIAAKVIANLFNDEIPQDDAIQLCKKAFPFSPKLKKLEEGLHILELFHGPSCAFKDFGASFLANSMEYFLKSEQRQALILTATSGDTGSAVAQAFYQKDNIDVVILYPKGRVSPLQEKQLTTLGGNIHALEVEGAFDDCQRMVKEAFTDPALSEALPLSSANSINLGRLIPQSLYYIWAFTQLKGISDEIIFCVPSGNFGNLTAGVLSWRWGLPVSSFIAATNANDVVPEYLQTGNYETRPSLATYSNAMDVGAPSNFERLLTIFQDDWNVMKSMIHGESISDEETLKTISDVYQEKGYILDPHTAVGVLASRRFREKVLTGGGEIVSLSTAHPGKFVEIVKEATGEEPQLPEALQKVMMGKKQTTVINNTLEELSAFLMDNFA